MTLNFARLGEALRFILRHSHPNPLWLATVSPFSLGSFFFFNQEHLLCLFLSNSYSILHMMKNIKLMKQIVCFVSFQYVSTVKIWVCNIFWFLAHCITIWYLSALNPSPIFSCSLPPNAVIKCLSLFHYATVWPPLVSHTVPQAVDYSACA